MLALVGLMSTTLVKGEKTCGGNANGAECKFPFSYMGQQYDSCTSRDHHQRWCYTTAPGRWGNCDCTENCSITLYHYEDNEGYSKEYTKSTPQLGVWMNDYTSSIEVKGDGCEAIVYEHINYQGLNLRLAAGTYSQDQIKAMGLEDNTISSFRLHKATPEPTANPTNAPTPEPTRNPTKTPTAEPTKAPTAEPTKNPTKTPTAEPTKAPTAEPTKNPTKTPTAEPTDAPTPQPTAVPTVCTVTVWTHDNFVGFRRTYDRNTPRFGIFTNDWASSVKVNEAGCEAIVYGDFNYAGWSVRLTTGSYTLGQLRAMGFKQNQMSSIKVGQIGRRRAFNARRRASTELRRRAPKKTTRTYEKRMQEFKSAVKNL